MPMMPDFISDLKILAEKTCLDFGLGVVLFNQYIINNYEVGQKISAHIDNPNFGPVIACFSVGLGQGISIKFRKDFNEYEHFTQNNSLYIMSGPARYNYTHEKIASRKTDIVNGIRIKRSRRISITFRTVPMT